MNHLLKFASLVKPHRWRAKVTLALLTAIVFGDLAIPRLIQPNGPRML